MRFNDLKDISNFINKKVFTKKLREELKEEYSNEEDYKFNIKDIEGYSNLTEENNDIFQAFIVKFYNTQKLEYIKKIIPRAIFYSETEEKMVKNHKAEETLEYIKNVKYTLAKFKSDGKNIWRINGGMGESPYYETKEMCIYKLKANGEKERVLYAVSDEFRDYEVDHISKRENLRFEFYEKQNRNNVSFNWLAIEDKGETWTYFQLKELNCVE